MKISIKYILFIFWIQLSVFTYAQSEIGISGGVHQSGFYGGKRAYHFDSSYKPYWSYAAAIYYKEPITTKLYAGFELEQMHVTSNLQFSKAAGVAHVYSYEALLDLDYINFHFLFGGNLFSIKETTISATLSPYYGYLIHSKAVGHGTKPIPYNITDSLGHTQQIIWSEPYDIHETKTQEVRKANVGVSLNLDATIPLQNKLSLLLKTSYNLGVYGVISEDAFIGIRGYAFSVGLVYKLEKKYIHFSEWEKYAKPTPR